MVLEVAPRSASERHMVMVMKVSLPNGAKKTLELVRQTKTMKVYVNPDPLGADEWDMDGQVFQVMTGPPPEHRSPAAIAADNTRNALWRET